MRCPHVRAECSLSFQWEAKRPCCWTASVLNKRLLECFSRFFVTFWNGMLDILEMGWVMQVYGKEQPISWSYCIFHKLHMDRLILAMVTLLFRSKVNVSFAGNLVNNSDSLLGFIIHLFLC